MKRQKLLLVDNHENMLAGLSSLLQPMFDRIFTVADEASLIEAAETIGPDLAVVDLSFEITSEINIVRLLKEMFPEIKLIVLSVYEDEIAINECMDAGANGFVLKRNAVDELIPAISAVLNNSS